MTRYITRATRPKGIEAGDDWYEPTALSLDVIVSVDEPVNTGLVDATGLPLYRVPTRNPIGFIRHEET